MRSSCPDSVKELRTWDRRVDERPVSLVYEAFEEALWRRTFADEMSVPLYERFYRYAGNERFAGLHAVIDRSPVCRGSTIGPRRHVVETRDDIVRRGRRRRFAALRARFGEPADLAMGRSPCHQVFASAGGRRRAPRLVLQPRARSGGRRQHDGQQDDDKSAAAVRDFRSGLVQADT